MRPLLLASILAAATLPHITPAKSTAHVAVERQLTSHHSPLTKPAYPLRLDRDGTLNAGVDRDKLLAADRKRPHESRRQTKEDDYDDNACPQTDSDIHPTTPPDAANETPNQEVSNDAPRHPDLRRVLRFVRHPLARFAHRRRCHRCG